MRACVRASVRKSKMISSIEWIPAGVANPNPQKYEMSATEQEMLNLMMTQSKDGPDTPVLASAVAAALEGRSKSARQSSSKSKTTTTTSHDLPADLRMDEYSSDDDDDDVDSSNDRTNCARVAALSQLLVGSDLINDDDDVDDDDKLEQQQNEDDVVVEEDDDEMEHHKADIDTARQRNRRAPRTRDDEEDDDDDEDDWEDIPDTREYEPIDVEGLKAMGLSNVGMMNDDSAGGDGQYRVNGDDGLYQNDDNDSEAEDVAISAHDALLVLAKAEDVSLFFSTSLDSTLHCTAFLTT